MTNKPSVVSRVRVLRCVAFVVGVGFASAAWTQSKKPQTAKNVAPPARPEFALQELGELDADSALGQIATEIFERVRRAADVRMRTVPTLIMVEGEELPQAWASPGGAVGINRAMLEACLRDFEQRPELASARLAYVFGHELAHLAFDSGRRALVDAEANRSAMSARVLAHDRSGDSKRRDEREAEYFGLHYALSAGFDLELILGETRNLWDLMEHQYRRHGQTLNVTHPGPRERYELLHTQIDGLVRAYPLFHWGTRLLQVGRYEDAVRLLDLYREKYIGPEVRTNLGIAHYQLAAGELADCDGALVSRYYLPFLIDAETIGTARTRRSTERSPCFETAAFRQHANVARSLLSSAAEMEPSNWRAQTNLASLLVLMGDASQALGPAKRARELSSDVSAQLTYAVALFEMGRENNIDTAGQAIDLLEEAGAREGAYQAMAWFNKARIWSDLGKEQEAASAWRTFLAKEPGGRWLELAEAHFPRGKRRRAKTVGNGMATCDAGELGLEPLGIEQLEQAGWRRLSLEGLVVPVAVWRGKKAKALEIDGELVVHEREVDKDRASELEVCLPTANRGAAAPGSLGRYPYYAVEGGVNGKALLVRSPARD